MFGENTAQSGETEDEYEIRQVDLRPKNPSGGGYKDYGSRCGDKMYTGGNRDKYENPFQQ